MIRDSFDFDCPNKYVDISVDRTTTQYTETNDENWFFVEHPLHEPQLNIETEEVETSIKKRPSLLKSGGNVMRIAQPSRKSESIEITSQRAKANTNPPLKTSVAPVTFTKPAVGNKRPLSHSQDSSTSEMSTKSGTAAARDMKSSNCATKTTATTTKAPAGGMSSRLEEYRQKKSASQMTSRPSSAAQSSTAKSASSTAAAKKSATKDDQDMLDILKKHNEKFAVAPLYEPSRHSVRDVRKWEKANGKVWSSLTPEEREVANKDITAMKAVQ